MSGRNEEVALELLSKMDLKVDILLVPSTPMNGNRLGLVTDGCDTAWMNQFLQDLSKLANPGSHIVLVVDGAGWQRSKSLVVPENVTLHFLPLYSPELNPIERLWKQLKERYLSNTKFSGMKDIMQIGCEAWMKLTDQDGCTICRTK
jgi:hypothetical protein